MGEPFDPISSSLPGANQHLPGEFPTEVPEAPGRPDESPVESPSEEASPRPDSFSVVETTDFVSSIVQDAARSIRSIPSSLARLFAPAGRPATDSQDTTPTDLADEAFRERIASGLRFVKASLETGELQEAQEAYQRIEEEYRARYSASGDDAGIREGHEILPDLLECRARQGHTVGANLTHANTVAPATAIKCHPEDVAARVPLGIEIEQAVA